MNTNYDFLFGIITGSVIGAGLVIALSPRLVGSPPARPNSFKIWRPSELRERVTASAADPADGASRRFDHLSTRIADAVDDVTTKGQALRTDVADAVGRRAREVDQFAMAAMTGHTPRPR